MAAFVASTSIPWNLRSSRFCCPTKASTFDQRAPAVGARRFGCINMAVSSTPATIIGTRFDSWAQEVNDASPNLGTVLVAIEQACKELGDLISRAPIDSLLGVDQLNSKNESGDTQKKLDVVSNELLQKYLQHCGYVAISASEEDDDPVVFDTRPSPSQQKYVVVFDPLDGSRNIDASIPTGTIFGVYKYDAEKSVQQNVLQTGRDQVASGYALYSSATEFVVGISPSLQSSLSAGQCKIFTLDRSKNAFVMTRPQVVVPPRGQVYSLNDARYFDWPEGLKKYIDTVRQGHGETGEQYSSRYICSLVADFHRTLLYGGWCANPRSHLRLVYEGNPLSLLCELAHGKGVDGKRNILDIQPEKLHQKLPLFLGSTDDIVELMKYDTIQQIGSKQYNV